MLCSKWSTVQNKDNQFFYISLRKPSSYPGWDSWRQYSKFIYEMLFTHMIRGLQTSLLRVENITSLLGKNAELKQIFSLTSHKTDSVFT